MGFGCILDLRCENSQVLFKPFTTISKSKVANLVAMDLVFIPLEEVLKCHSGSLCNEPEWSTLLK